MIRLLSILIRFWKREKVGQSPTPPPSTTTTATPVPHDVEPPVVTEQSPYRYFSRVEILRASRGTIPPELESNLLKLLEALNKFREIYGKPMLMRSLYRDPIYNAAIGGAKNSAHLYCLACDFADPSGYIDAFAMANPNILESCGLWLEHPSATPGWAHIQVRPIASGSRVFLP